MKKNDLPSNIPIFPLSNAIFFPKTILPLNIFDDRYIQLIEDCMKGKRIFGMVQPKKKLSSTPEVYQVGCLGKIVTFNEASDKRFIISLSGISRFKIKKELKTDKLYRIFSVDYSDFIDDFEFKKNNIVSFNKNILLKKVKIFFNKLNYSLEFNELLKLDFDQLVNTVSMVAPFSGEEKQKLLETIKIEEKIKLLEQIIDFNLVDIQENKTIQ